MKMQKPVVSFLVSGRGSNFLAVAEKIQSGYIPAVCGVVISNREDAGALKLAKDLDIANYCILSKSFATTQDYETKMIEILNTVRTDLVIGAGFLKILSPFFINAYKNKIINVHPALLPSFPGMHAQKQALDYGVRITGCSTHFMDEGTDTGPIILQAMVHVREDDTESTLSQRILHEEHIILCESVKLFCQGKLHVSGRKVIIQH